MKSSEPISIVSSISDVARSYDVWLCDIWGVMHNGVRPFQTAVEACARFKETGGKIVYITNSPRPSDRVIEQLDQIGVPRDVYDAVISSGDVARALVASRPGRPIFHLGPDRDRPIFAGLDIQLCEIPDAEIVLCSGLFDDDTETPDDYEAMLIDLKSRDLPLVCANPDIVVERGDRLVYCAGALAKRYREMGGQVIYTGKPAQQIYDLALAKANAVAGRELVSESVLAIGDGLKTDIAGAVGAGLDYVFVASAIHVEGHNEHAALDSAAMNGLFEGVARLPVAAMPRLAW